MANYKGVYYDPNIDYAAEIGKTTDPNEKAKLTEARNAKITDNPGTYGKYAGSDYIPTGSVYNSYGEVIGTSPTGESTTIHGDKGTAIHGGWDSGGYSGVSSNTSNIGGTNVNLLNGISYGNTADETPQPDPNEEMLKIIEQMKEAQRQSRYAALDKQYQASQSALDSEKSSIEPTYYNKRNQAAGQSDLAALNFAQRAAARGIKGNAGMMPEIYRNASLQGQIGALDQQEAAANADIERRRSGLTSAYQSDRSAADADIEAQGLQNYINQMNANRQYDLAAGEQLGTIGGNDTLAKQQFDYSKSSTNPNVYAQVLANKKQELDNLAQQIQNSYLPDTLKLQLKELQQKVQMGAIDIDTALSQANKIKSNTSYSGYNPTNIIDKLTQMKNATIQTGTTGNASGLINNYAPKYTTDDLMKYLYQQGISPADAEGYLSQIGISL